MGLRNHCLHWEKGRGEWVSSNFATVVYIKIRMPASALLEKK